jgi:hypothetical protein
MTTRACKTCNGEGRNFSKGFTTAEGKVYEDTWRKCFSCDGVGHFNPPNALEIWKEIKGKKGLRSSLDIRKRTSRGYYVWRMARFHGGADVTMPMGASSGVYGDPFKGELDAIADVVAKHCFGTDLAAAHRWGRVLGHLDRDMPGLPASAYGGGPVHDGNKPIEEALELL